MAQSQEVENVVTISNPDLSEVVAVVLVDIDQDPTGNLMILMILTSFLHREGAATEEVEDTTIGTQKAKILSDSHPR